MKYYDIASLDSVGGRERQLFCSTLKDTDLYQLSDGLLDALVNSGE